jgi:hypothetical protein
LDQNKIASYMSPHAAKAVFRKRYFEPHTQQEQLAEAWDDLREADNFDQQRNAVMELSDMIFGDRDCWRCWRRGVERDGCNCVGYTAGTMTDTSSQANLTVNGVIFFGTEDAQQSRNLITDG